MSRDADEGLGPFQLRSIGVLRSELAELAAAPRQGSEGAPDAWLEVEEWARVTVRAIDGCRVRVGPIEAIDRTPVVDIKSTLA